MANELLTAEQQASKCLGEEYRVPDLACKYARQLDHVEDLRKSVQLAEASLRREQEELSRTELQLKNCLPKDQRVLLTQISGGRWLVIMRHGGIGGNYVDYTITKEVK